MIETPDTRSSELFTILAENLLFLKVRYPDVVALEGELYFCTILVTTHRHSLQVIVTEQDEIDSEKCKKYAIGFLSLKPDKPTAVMKLDERDIPNVLYDSSVYDGPLSPDAARVFNRVYDIVMTSLCNNS